MGNRLQRLPLGLAVAAVGLQIAYPLVSEGVKDRLTVATVVVFAAASLSHAVVSRGWRVGLAALLVFSGGGLAVEVLGVATGFPFGDYVYVVDRLGPSLAEVPLVIPLAWSMLGWPAFVVARRIVPSAWPGVLVGGFALTAWDLFLDPQMVAEGYWTWTGAGPYLLDGIPVTNYVAWLVVSVAMMAAMWLVTAEREVGGDDTVPVVLYVWTWAGSALAHAAFFGLPRSSLYGGLGMGAVVVALWRASARAGAREADRKVKA